MTDEDEDKADGSGQGKRLTNEEFLAAKDLYELGKMGIADIAKDLGVSRQALSRRFTLSGIIKNSRVNELNAQANAAAIAAAKATTERYAEKRTEWIEETRLEGVKGLKQVRMIGQKIIGDAVKASTAAGTRINLSLVDDDLRALSRFNKVLIDNFNTALSILKSDEHVDDEDLPILTIEDLTDEDILKHHIATGALDEDATIEDINTGF